LATHHHHHFDGTEDGAHAADQSGQDQGTCHAQLHILIDMLRGAIVVLIQLIDSGQDRQDPNDLNG